MVTLFLLALPRVVFAQEAEQFEKVRCYQQAARLEGMHQMLTRRCAARNLKELLVRSPDQLTDADCRKLQARIEEVKPVHRKHCARERALLRDKLRRGGEIIEQLRKDEFKARH